MLKGKNMKTITRKELAEKLGAFRRVKNAPSRNGYNTAPNQFIIRFANGVVLQSYDSLVAVKMDNGEILFGADHDYSATTNRFVKEFSGRTASERRQMLENEEATLIEG